MYRQTDDTKTEGEGQAPFSREIPELLEKHLQHLKESAISVEVIRERGYRSVLGKTPLKEAGFSPAQRRPPGILIPLHAPDGSAAVYQYRPDRPREKEGGKIIKYENPLGAAVRLDVPPRCRQQLKDPSIEMWFTEGIKKADALATAGACAVGLNGVWGWKGRNPLGGTTILADFDYIAFKDRQCYLVFDSDIATNPKVRQALDRLSEHLSRKGALVHLIFLPAGAGGDKNGADEYLAAGHTLQEVKALEATTPPAAPKPHKKGTTSKYGVADGVLVWVKSTSEAELEIPLCNFDARIIEDILKDNGLESNRYYKLEAKLLGENFPRIIETPASEFKSMNWVDREIGVKGIIAAGQSSQDRLREAIKCQSMHARQRTIFTHTGWRDIDGELTFLSGSGALDREDIEVELEPTLQRYQLPKPVGDPVEAIRKSFNFHLVATPEVSFPLWTAMYLAPLSELLDPAFTLWLVGPSGAFKSTLTSLALCHFGTFDAHHLPASWRDTGNQFEKLLFLCKDLPLVIDDWAPGQDTAKARELEAKAEYIVRAQGNRQGRGRMRADTSSRPVYVPRGMLITTGEQLPSGHSHTARIYSIEVERSDVDVPYMGTAQAEHDYYCVAMTHYIAWLKRHWPTLNESLRKRWQDYRDKVQEEETHPRLAEVIAWLYCALELVTEYALDHGAITASELENTRKTSWDIFTKLAAKQSGRIELERPATRALELWRAMIDTGTAVFWNKDNDSPGTPSPGQKIIGWFDNSSGESSLLLDPTAAHGALVEYGNRIGQPFTIKPEALWKDMRRLELIEHTNGRCTVRSRIYGALKYVIKIKNPRVLYQKSENSENNDNV